MPIEKIEITSRDQWLAARARDVTASSAAALLGCHPFTSAFALWASKSGRLVEDAEETPAMRRGTDLEPIAFKYLRETRPDWQISWNGTPGEADGFYFRDPAARLGATPDAFAVCPDRGPGVIQVKSVEPSIFRRQWHDPETGDVQPPLGYAVQVLVEAHLTGANWAALAVLLVSHGIEIEVVPVPIHVGVLDRIRNEVAAFWRAVESGHAPDPDYGRDADLIGQLYAPDGTTVSLAGDNAAVALADEKTRLGTEKTATEKRLKEIKAELLVKLGGASVGQLADGRLITASTVNRKAYAVAASSYIDLRIKGTAA